MSNTIVKLPLNSEIEYAIASGDYNAITLELLSHLDLLYTFFFRYPRLLTVDINGSKDSQGFAIDFTDSHPAAAITTTIIFGGIAIAGAINIYEQKRRAHAEKVKRAQYSNTAQLVNSQLEENKNELSIVSKTYTNSQSSKEESTLYSVSGADRSVCSKVALDRYKLNFNNDLAALLEKDEQLKKKYKSIKFGQDHIEVTLNDEPEKKLTWAEKAGKKMRAVAESSWVTMGICSFVYWILWIGAGVITGNFDIGIKALGAAAFAVPAIIAAAYPAIKTRNWWKNHFGNKTANSKGETVQVTEEPKVALEAAADLTRLMRKIAYANEEKRLRAELLEAGKVVPIKAEKSVSVLAHDDLTLSLGKNKWRKTAGKFLETTVNNYIGAQYIAWVTADFLKLAADVTLNLAGLALGLGIVVLAGSVIHGAYKAYKQYKEVQKFEKEIAPIAENLKKNEVSMEAVFNNKKTLIQELKAKILAKHPDQKEWVEGQEKNFSRTMAAAPRDAHEEAKKESFLRKAASTAYAFLNGITGGAMLGRGGLLIGTFTLPIIVGAVANPYTIGIVVALGLIYGAFKAYQHYQTKKENLAKAVLAQREEKVESLKEQIDLADLQIKLLEAKVETLDAGKPDASSNLKAGMFGHRTDMTHRVEMANDPEFSVSSVANLDSISVM